jgi:hypothetical protein
VAEASDRGPNAAFTDRKTKARIADLGGTVLVFEPSAYCRRQSARTGPRREEDYNAGGDFSAAEEAIYRASTESAPAGNPRFVPYHGAAFKGVLSWGRDEVDFELMLRK